MDHYEYLCVGFFTFLSMTLAGYELRTSEVFTVLSIFNAMQVNMETERQRERERN